MVDGTIDALPKPGHPETSGTPTSLSVDWIFTVSIFISALFVLGLSAYTVHGRTAFLLHPWRMEDIPVLLFGWVLILLAPFVSLRVTRGAVKDSAKAVGIRIRYHLFCIMMLVFGAAVHGSLLPSIPEVL